MTEYFTKLKISQLISGMRIGRILRKANEPVPNFKTYPTFDTQQISNLEQKVLTKVKQITSQDLKNALVEASQKRRNIMRDGSGD